MKIPRLKLGKWMKADEVRLVKKNGVKSIEIKRRVKKRKATRAKASKRR